MKVLDEQSRLIELLKQMGQLEKPESSALCDSEDAPDSRSARKTEVSEAGESDVKCENAEVSKNREVEDEGANVLPFIPQKCGDDAEDEAETVVADKADVQDKTNTEKFTRLVKEYNEEAATLSGRGEFRKAVEAAWRAHGLARLYLGEESVCYCSTLQSLASAYEGNGEFGKALSLWRDE